MNWRASKLKMWTAGHGRFGGGGGHLKGHLGTPPALLPLLLLQLSVLHCELQAGQLAHEGLVAHMQRGRDGQLQANRKFPQTSGES